MKTILYKEGIFYIQDTVTLASEIALFPKDSQLQSAPVAMGFDYDTGNFVPIAVTPDGKVKVDESL